MSEKEVVFTIKAVASDEAIANIEAIEKRLQTLHDLSSLTLSVKPDDEAIANIKAIEDRFNALHERSEITIRMKADPSVNATLSSIEERLDRLHQRSTINVRQGQSRDPSTGRFTSQQPPQKSPTTKPVRGPRPPKKMGVPSGALKFAQSLPVVGQAAKVASWAGTVSDGVSLLDQSSPGFVDNINSFANRSMEWMGVQAPSRNQGFYDVNVPTQLDNVSLGGRLAGHAGTGGSIASMVPGAGILGGLVGAAAYGLPRTAIEYVNGTAQAEAEAAMTINTNEANYQAATARVPWERRQEEERIRLQRQDEQLGLLSQRDSVSQMRTEFGMEIGSIRRNPGLRDQSLSLDRMEAELREREQAARGKAEISLDRASNIRHTNSFGAAHLGDESDARAAEAQGKAYLNEVKEVQQEINRVYGERLRVVKEISSEEQRDAKTSLKTVEGEMRDMERRKGLMTREREKALERNQDAEERFSEMGIDDQALVLRAKAKADRGESLDAFESKALKQLGPAEAIENIRRQNSKKVSEEFGFKSAFGDDFSADMAKRDSAISGVEVAQSEANERKAEIEKQIESIKETEREATMKIEEAMSGLGPAVAASVEKMALEIVRQIERGIATKANGG